MTKRLLLGMLLAAATLTASVLELSAIADGCPPRPAAVGAPGPGSDLPTASELDEPSAVIVPVLTR